MRVTNSNNAKVPEVMDSSLPDCVKKPYSVIPNAAQRSEESEYPGD